jgi:hypothetical protein
MWFIFLTWRGKTVRNCRNLLLDISYIRSHLGFGVWQTQHKCWSVPVPCLWSTDITAPFSLQNVIDTSITFPSGIALFWLPHFLFQHCSHTVLNHIWHTHTVGAKSITHLFKKCILLQQNISGLKHDRELWFYCLIGLWQVYYIEMEKCKNI